MKDKSKVAGGVARAEALPAERRKQIAEKAAKARWGPPVIKATHGSADHPLKLGGVEIPCYVLEDGTRVLSQRGIVAGLGMTYGSRQGGADRLTGFAVGKGISPFINKDMMALIQNPIKFSHSGGGGAMMYQSHTQKSAMADTALQEIVLTLSEAAIRNIDAIAEQQGISRSQVVENYFGDGP